MKRVAFDREVFARLWNNHAITTQRIADAMGITRAGVSWHAHRMGLPSRAKLRARKIEPELFREMWEAGVKASEIAEHFGMAHHSCAVTAARKMGLSHRKRGPAGKMNGGWVANTPMADFLQGHLARRMAESAAQTRIAMGARGGRAS